nr:Os04g0165801 [Ipomoea batatas]
MLGFWSLRNRPAPEMVPPVPMPATTPFIPVAGSVTIRSAPKAFRRTLLSRLIDAGIVKMSLYPLEAAIKASPMPVLPLRLSISPGGAICREKIRQVFWHFRDILLRYITFPGEISPFSSASAIILNPILKPKDLTIASEEIRFGAEVGLGGGVERVAERKGFVDERSH